MIKIILIILAAGQILYAELVIQEGIIYDGVINIIKKIPESIGNLGEQIYKTQIKGEKGFYWYFNTNQKIKIELNKRKINYSTILKEKMYPVKIYDNSIETEKKKYYILSELAKKNNIKINNIEINEKENKEKKQKSEIERANAKEELKKQMSN